MDPLYNIYNLSSIPANDNPIFYWKKYQPILALAKKQPQPALLPNKARDNRQKELEEVEYLSDCRAFIEDITQVNNLIALHEWMAPQDNYLPIDKTQGIVFKNKDKLFFHPLNGVPRNDVAKHFKIDIVDDKNKYGFHDYINLPESSTSLYLSYVNNENQIVACLNKPIILEKKPEEIKKTEFLNECHANFDNIQKNADEINIYGWIAGDDKLPIKEQIGISYKIDEKMYFYELEKSYRLDVAKYFNVQNTANMFYGFNEKINIPENSTDFHLSYIDGNTTRICKNLSLSM